MFDIFSEVDADAMSEGSPSLAGARGMDTDQKEAALVEQPLAHSMLPSVGTTLRPTSCYPLLARATELKRLTTTTWEERFMAQLDGLMKAANDELFAQLRDVG